MIDPNVCHTERLRSLCTASRRPPHNPTPRTCVPQLLVQLPQPHVDARELVVGVHGEHYHAAAPGQHADQGATTQRPRAARGTRRAPEREQARPGALLDRILLRARTDSGVLSAAGGRVRHLAPIGGGQGVPACRTKVSLWR